MFIRMDEKPFRKGRMLGELSSGALNARINSMKEIQRKRRIGEKLLLARAKDFKHVLEKAAPLWLEEVAGMARGSGVDADDILKLNCLPPDFHQPSGNNCTSFIHIGENQNMLFKIRDERNHAQQFFIHPMEHGASIHVGRDIGNIGAAHAFSSDAVAFANNTGSQTHLVDDIPRLNDCHILRYLSENVRKVEDAPKAFERLADGGLAGGAGKERGCIFLLADREKGLILETAAGEYSVTWVNKGTKVVANHFVSRRARGWDAKTPSKSTVVRKKRMEELLAKFNNPPSIQDVFRISRDRRNIPHALCNDDKKHFWMTISAQVQLINRNAPESSENYICCGNTRHSVYLLFPAEYKKSFIPLVNGEFYKFSDGLYKRFACSDHLKTIQTRFEKRFPRRGDTAALCLEAADLSKTLPMSVMPPEESLGALRSCR